MLSPRDQIRDAIQAVLDAEGDGWVVGPFVVALGLEKVAEGGQVESTAWVWAPADQPDWVTDGLLRAAVELREDADIDTD